MLYPNLCWLEQHIKSRTPFGKKVTLENIKSNIQIYRLLSGLFYQVINKLLSVVPLCVNFIVFK